MGERMGRERDRDREFNKLLVSWDSSVEREGLQGRGGGGEFWGFSSSLLQPVDLPGYRRVWSWWWDAGVQS